MKLKSEIHNALKYGLNNTYSGNSKQIMHRNRSRDFVEKLAESFRHEYSGDKFRTFSKHYAGNKTEFGLNELLYDIAVCETKIMPSTRNKKTLRYVTKNIWSVESELARDSHESIKDFNKLVMSNSENKLFIAPEVNKIDDFLNTLKTPAKCCSGNVFLAIVPHPEKWDVNISVSVYQLKKDEWVII